MIKWWSVLSWKWHWASKIESINCLEMYFSTKSDFNAWKKNVPMHAFIVPFWHATSLNWIELKRQIFMKKFHITQNNSAHSVSSEINLKKQHRICFLFHERVNMWRWLFDFSPQFISTDVASLKFTYFCYIFVRTALLFLFWQNSDHTHTILFFVNCIFNFIFLI